jgi:hypothetical protein
MQILSYHDPANDICGQAVMPNLINIPYIAFKLYGNYFKGKAEQ